MNSQMSPDLFNLIKPHLDAYEFKERQEWLQQGICPNCGKKELFTHAQNPWVLKCNRLNNCGYEAHAKELWPELFTDWSKRASFIEEQKPKEQQNPNAAADLYLKEGRGFDLNLIKGWYSQESFVDHKTLEGTATVRFPVAAGHWERLIDRPERFGSQKARFNGKYGGRWWQPPSFNDALLNEITKLWIVEGIFDAIAFFHNGMHAVSIMTSGNYPEQALQELERIRGDKRGLTLVWALDRGAAGETHIKKFYDRAIDDGWKCQAALPPRARDSKKQNDWNDLHLLNRLSNVDEYLYYGALLTASSAAEKGFLIREKTKKNNFHFDHQNRLYFLELNAKKIEDAKNQIRENGSIDDPREIEIQALTQSGSVQLIAQCNPKALYYQRNEITDESWYYYQIDFPHKSQCSKGTFTSSQLSTPTEFKKRLLHLARGAIYTGKQLMLDSMLIEQLYNIKEVKTIGYLGYSKENGVYIFSDVAVQNGNVIHINEEDYFELEGNKQLKSLSSGVEIKINTNPQKYNEKWLDWLWECAGAKGYVALVYWFGSLFAEQLRNEFKRFPFLEMIGSPGAGKSMLLEFLWKLTGRLDYEGFNPGKSSFAGRSRTFEHVSNLPVALIESDYGADDKNPKTKAFDFDELKDLYNGRPIRTTGYKNSGNETHAPPFRAALVISQNNPVVAQKAVLERICQVSFSISDHSDSGAIAADKIEKIPMEEISYFVVKAIGSEKQTLQIIKEVIKEYQYEIKSKGSVFVDRLAFNHALLMAITDAFVQVFNVPAERHAQTHNQLFEMAAQRQQAVNSDCKEVYEFWEAYEFMHKPNSKLYDLNHSTNPDQIAINLNHFYAAASELGQRLPDLTQLRKVIKTSARHKFIVHKNVNSAVELKKVLKCYVFESKQSQGED